MASSKPVITISTPLDDNAQIELVDNGETGFTTGTPKDAIKSIIKLANNKSLMEIFGRNGYIKARNKFDAKKLTNKLEKIYIELLKSKGIGIDDRIISKYETINLEEDLYFEREYVKRIKAVICGSSLSKAKTLCATTLLLKLPLLWRLIYILRRIVNYAMSELIR